MSIPVGVVVVPVVGSVLLCPRIVTLGLIGLPSGPTFSPPLFSILFTASSVDVTIVGSVGVADVITGVGVVGSVGVGVGVVGAGCSLPLAAALSNALPGIAKAPPNTAPPTKLSKYSRLASSSAIFKPACKRSSTC